MARKATQAPWEPEGDDATDDEVLIDVDGEDWRFIICRGPQSRENMLHVAANDPRDTIARCEAELAILDEHYILTSDDRNPAYEELSVYPWGAAAQAIKARVASPATTTPRAQ